MDNLFTVLIILFLIVGPILEKLLKAGRQAGQQPQPQQRRRSMPEDREQLPDGRTMTMSRPAEEQESRDATDLLPAELWEILTGQKRQETPAQPQQQTQPAEPRPQVTFKRKTMAERRAEVERKRAARMAAERGEVLYDEEAAATDLMRRREQAQATRRSYDHTAPKVVSLETEPAPEPIRHAAFHDRLDRLTKTPRRRQTAANPFDLDLDDQAALQRAVLLQEVLGPPKGLD